MTIAFAAITSATAYAEMQHGQSHDQPGNAVMHHHGQNMKKKMDGKMPGGKGTGSHNRHTSAPSQGDCRPSSAAFNAMNQIVHETMNMTFSGNVDADFINSMIPHHQGAVELAKVVLAFGSDPEIRRFKAIVRAQSR